MTDSSWIRSCAGKSRYATYEKAERYKLKAETARPGTTLRIYPCRHCHGYHLTSKPLIVRTTAPTEVGVLA